MFKRVWGWIFISLTFISLGFQSNDSVNLLITEVFYDTPGRDEEREWIEITNLSPSDYDLSDVKIGDEETAGGNEGMRRFPDGAMIGPGQTVVVAQTAAGFRELYGRNPDYEIGDTDPAVPDMRGFPLWASGELALSNQGDELLLVDGFEIIDALNYGASSHFFNPPIALVNTGQSVERVPADCDTDSAVEWIVQSTPTPGRLSFDGECPAPVIPTDWERLTPIGAIQGPGDISPFLDQIITFRGIVTGLYEDRNAEGIIFYTLFLQDLPGHEDDDPATSDGLAVFLARERPSFVPGDQIMVTGRVTEFFGYTEIDHEGLDIVLEAHNLALPTPIPLAPPTGRREQAAYFEPLESMLVTLDDTANVVGPTYSGCGFAVVRSDSGLSRPIKRSGQEPSPPVLTVLHTSDVSCGRFPAVKTGDRITGITGPLIYNFDEFKIVQQETKLLQLTAVPRPEPPPPPKLSATGFSIASLNVENHFDSLDDTGSTAEPKPTPDEIAIKQAKLAYAIGHVLGCPTFVGIQEIEKASLLLSLAEKTAEYCGFIYTVTHLESADSRGIDLALLSHPNQVTIADAALAQTCTPLPTGINDESIHCDPGQEPLFSRPPLVVSADIDSTSLTIIVNHFKSKREGEAETASRRLAQAQHIVTIVQELRKQNEQAQIIVLGDFNDFEQSAPMVEMMLNGRLTNLLLQIPDEERYSLIFGGVSQLIDGILATDNLKETVTAVSIFHTNADYPFNLGADSSSTNIAYRSTDHDIPLVVFALRQEPEPIITPTFIPPITASPTSTPKTAEAEEHTADELYWVWGGLGAAFLAVLSIILFKKRRAI